MNRLSIIGNLMDMGMKISQTKDLIKNVYLGDQIPWVIGYSGGKDSTTTTQLVVESLSELRDSGEQLHKKIYIISSDTLVETPMIKNIIHNNISNINKLADKLQLPIEAHIVAPKVDQTFWVNVIGRGYPTPNQTFRWCTDRMKIDPANRFIMDVVDQFGEAIMVLGVRDGESNSRDRVLQSHTVAGHQLMRHTTMPNAYVFAPIRNFSIDDVWNYLLAGDTPWGTKNDELYKLYSESSSECPLVIDKNIKNEAGSCGNSRFGCWVCTVVKEDKSLTGYINSGEEWLRPMLGFRNWLYSIRDSENLRMHKRSNGSLYFSKIKTNNDGSLLIPEKTGRQKTILKKTQNGWFDQNNIEWHVFESNNAEYDAKEYISTNKIDLSSGENPRIIIKNHSDEYMRLGNGPYTLEARKEILKRLLKVQEEVGDNELYKPEELLEIRKIWLQHGDWEDSLPKIYFEITGKVLQIDDYISFFSDEDMRIIYSTCINNDFDFSTYNSLISLSKEYAGLTNRTEIQKKIQSVMSKEFLVVENFGEVNED